MVNENTDRSELDKLLRKRKLSIEIVADTKIRH